MVSGTNEQKDEEVQLRRLLYQFKRFHRIPDDERYPDSRIIRLANYNSDRDA